jgi:phytoene synthase
LAAPATDRAEEDRLILEAFRRNARTFALAARLLPRRLRLPVATLYLDCRTVDEIADRRPRDDASGLDAAAELQGARAEFAATRAGRPPTEGQHGLLWRRLAALEAEFGLDWDAMAELLDGAKWDLDGRPIETRADLLAYSELVAGSVGAMMLPLIVADASLRARLVAPARALGVAMQVTNILRDVGEDKQRLGRVYLPREWMTARGLSTTDLDAPGSRDYALLCEELMALAETMYDAADAGIRELPVGSRLAVRVASRMYREILNEVRAARYDNITRRAVVPLGRKVMAAAGRYEPRRKRLISRAPLAA